MMRKIDVYTHILPRRFLEALEERVPQALANYNMVAMLPSLTDVETRLRVMEPYEGYQQVLTLAGPPVESLAQGETLLHLTRLANDEMAALVERHPDRFVAFAAALPLSDVEASLAEMERAIVKLGARGVQLFTNVNGVPLDEPRFTPIFERMASYDLPIWIHPWRGPDFPDYPAEDRSRYNLWQVFGWPYDTAVTLTRLVFAGYLKRFPNLKIIAHHAGGVLPHFGERVRDFYDLIIRGVERMRRLIEELGSPPQEQLRLIYGDTALNGSLPALNCALAFFGSHHLLFGTDFPFDTRMGASFIEGTIKAIEGLAISAEEREGIYGANAARLLRLTLKPS